MAAAAAAATAELPLYRTRYMPTIGDGSCFFRALYKCMAPRPDVLAAFKARYPDISTQNQKKFLETVRDYLADAVLVEDVNPTIYREAEAMYAQLQENYRLNRNSLGAMLNTFPHYLSEPIETRIVEEAADFFPLDEFKTLLSEGIRPSLDSDDNMAGQWEVEQVIAMLKAARIELKLFMYTSGHNLPESQTRKKNSAAVKRTKQLLKYGIPPELPMRNAAGQHLLYMVNEDIVHYSAIELVAAAGGRRSHRTRRLR